MVHFPHSPLIRLINDGQAILEEDFLFKIKVKEKNYEVLIKAGFVFDGASIPRFCWRIIGHPFQMPLLVCATPHDILYASESFTQSECDWIFIELMQLVKINWIKRNLVWSAVRCGGYFVWKSHTEKSIDNAKSYIRIVEIEEKPEELECLLK